MAKENLKPKACIEVAEEFRHNARHTRTIDGNRFTLHAASHKSGPYLGVYVNGDESTKIDLHRLVCWYAWGAPPSPDRNKARHWVCDNGWCISPRHLDWGSKAENLRDRVLNQNGKRARDERGRFLPNIKPCERNWGDHWATTQLLEGWPNNEGL